MFVVVGLGNPGIQYQNTRHNVGFLFLDSLAHEAQLKWSSSPFQALTAKGLWRGKNVILVQPQTYMNLSGSCVRKVLSFFKIPESHMAVAFDDLDLPNGKVKTRLGGSHGGHNGIRSILEHAADDRFFRIKIGIGKPEYKSATHNWVLGKIPDADLIFFQEQSFPLAQERLENFLKTS